jgi:hypothetical protein
MTSVNLNDQEQRVLDQLDYIYEALYRRGIRRYMDFQTGIVGIKRGISWESLKEELFVEPRIGVKPKKISKEQVRRLAKHLERAGLIKIKSSSTKLVFDCLLATSDKSVQNKADTKADTLNLKFYQKADIPYDVKKPVKSSVLDGLNKIADTSTYKNNTKANTKADTPPNNNIYISTNVDILSDLQIKKLFEEYFWQPYPQGHRVKKKHAYEKYKRKKYYLSPMKEKIRDDILLRKENHRPWIDGFVPHPTTYLNGERWNDEIQKEILNVRKVNGNHRGDSITRVLNSCFDSIATDVDSKDENNPNKIAKVG